MSDPLLPPEIEEAILSLAVQTDWSSAKNFILVAKRVYEWLTPQIYKVQVYHIYRDPGQRPTLDSRNLIYHGKHVRRVMLYNGDTSTTYLHHRPGKCLAMCPNAFDVALWISPDQYDLQLVNQLLQRNLTHLSLNLGSFESAITSLKDAELSIPLSFPHVTHLDVIGIQPDVAPKVFKERFPALTHLALNSTIYNITKMTADILEIFQNQLEVLIWYQADMSNPSPAVVTKPKQRPPEDPRIVVLTHGYVRTWYEGAIGGLGLWRVAEEVLVAQQEAAVN